MSVTKSRVHTDFKQEVEQALRVIAEKYNVPLRGVGVAHEKESVIVIARFGGVK